MCAIGKIDVSIGHYFLARSEVRVNSDFFLLQSQESLYFFVVAEECVIPGIVAVPDEPGGVINEEYGVCQHEEGGRTVAHYHAIVLLENVVAEVHHVLKLQY